MTDKELVKEIAGHISAISSLLGFPVTESNKDTPLRVAKMYCNELFRNRNNRHLNELNAKMKVFPAENHNPVTVEVPVADPTTVPTASAKSASFILGILPFSSNIPARLAVPTSVPMVSNMSMIQKVTIRVITVNQPICANPLKLNLNSVVSAIS